MHSTFANAKRCFRFVAALQWLLAVLGAWVILTKSDSAYAVLAVFLGSLMILVVQQIGKTLYARGERIRQSYVLEKGLGILPADSELLDILAKEPAPVAGEPQPLEGYYSASTSAGVPRFLHQLHESAFWTSALARAAAYVNYTISGLGLIATLIVAFLLLHSGAGAQPSSPDYAKLFVNLLLFFLAGSTLATAGSYWSLATEAERVAGQAAVLRKENTPDLVATLRLAGRYDIALAKGLPLPSWAYKLLQAKLHASWKSVCGSGDQLSS